MATIAFRQAASTVARISASGTSTQAASLIQRRGLAGAADHHGPPKINCWQDPMSPSKWKEHHFVIVSLSGWGLVFYGGYKYLTRGKKGERILKYLNGQTEWPRTLICNRLKRYTEFWSKILGNNVH